MGSWRSTRRKAVCLLHLLIWFDYGVSAIRDVPMNEEDFRIPGGSLLESHADLATSAPTTEEVIDDALQKSKKMLHVLGKAKAIKDNAEGVANLANGHVDQKSLKQTGKLLQNMAELGKIVNGAQESAADQPEADQPEADQPEAGQPEADPAAAGDE
eukprot:Skav215284  [mRNA]  locus=scaffold2522:163644:166489:- [translate_table: standard]